MDRRLVTGTNTRTNVILLVMLDTFWTKAVAEGLVRRMDSGQALMLSAVVSAVV